MLCDFIVTATKNQFVLHMGVPIRVPSFACKTDFALKLTHVTAVRGYALLFSGLNFEMGPGQFAAVRGPNGAGKTTLLRMVAGLSEPEDGKIEFGFEDIGYGRGINFLGHELGLRSSETPYSHLRDWADIHSLQKSGIADILERLGLSRRRDVPVWSLSAGQKKRVALARTLIAPSPLWLLDEPASALDVSGQALLCDLMREHLQSGGSILAALHDPMELKPDLDLDIGAFAP